MALFGRPSEKLIQSYRDKLQIVPLEGRLAIRTGQVELFCFKPERFELLATYGDFSIICGSEQVNLSVSRNAPRDADLQLPPLQVRQGNLLSVDDLRALNNTEACELPVAWPRKVALISLSEIESRSVDLTNLNVIVGRFSFPPVQNHAMTSLFGQRPAPRAGGVRVAPVTAPDAPPSLNKETLKERLRWLLTPPIHEILSDPQLALPETPYSYQTHGIKWLYDRESALLADEMGLGKTMQAIIAARLLWRDGSIKQILIVCPKSLMSNWQKELRTWWAGVESYTQVVAQDCQWFLRLATRDVTVKIINYERLAKELDWLKEKRPHHDLVIIDEAQRIKNPKSKRAQAVKTLDAKRRWALTGTPLENSTNDLVSIFGFIRPRLISETDSQARIRESIKPYMLRRRQEEVLPDLPEMIAQDIEIELGDQQREAYDRALREGEFELDEKGDSVTITHVFALINRLRQICNFHPVSGESAKTALVLEKLEEIMESGRKALIFCYFVQEPFGLKRLAKVISESKTFANRERPLELHGEIAQQRRDTIIKRFEEEETQRLLLANYSVGGVGLNLQVANYVFLFDRWWNPAWEDQAIKRAHRVGQKRRVFAIRLFCKDTIEERILKKLKEKRRLFTNVIDDKPSAASLGLSEDEIFSLFNLKVRPQRTGQRTVPARIILENVDDKAFEELVAMVYEKEGYKVQVTGRSHDGGIDIVAERVNAGGNDRIVVQCKHQKQNVGRPDLQRLWGVGCSDSRVTRCDFVTSAGFTAEAQEFARGKRLTLIDGGKLKERVHKLGVAEFVDLPTHNRGGDDHHQPIAEIRSSDQQVGATSKVKPRGSRLDKWEGTMTLSEVRTKLKQSEEFAGSWERFLDHLELPLGKGLTNDTTVAQARRLAEAWSGSSPSRP
jgi:superfamily II DNA or RNA helicase